MSENQAQQPSEQPENTEKQNRPDTQEEQDQPETASAAYAASPSENTDEFADALKAELDKTKDQLMRALAESDNTRKRAIKDREDASKFAISSFARDLLGVADNLGRALEATPTDLLETEPRLKNLVEGIEATQRELLKTFEQNGIEPINPLHEPFDPNLHEVMFEAPAEGQPAGTVMQVVETGYMLKDRLLRPARVGVAKDEGQDSTQTQNTPPSPGGTVDTEA